jgi:hypothetical protein
MRALLTGLLAVAGIGLLGRAAVVPAARAADGALVASPRFVPEAGPIFAGRDTLAWVSRRDPSVLDLWVGGPGRGPQRVQRFVGSDTERLRSPRLSASSTTVGLELLVTRAGRGGEDRVVGSRSYLGAVGQPLRLAGRCAGASPVARSLDVQELAAVFRGPRCPQVTVRRLAQDAAVTRRLPDGVFATRLAGRFEAWLEGPTGSAAAVVRDAASGREVSRVPAGALPGTVVDQALGDDGTLALLYASGPSHAAKATRLALVDPGATRARKLALTVLAADGPRWIGRGLGVVAARRAAPRAGVLEVVDAQGAVTRRIVELGTDRELMRHTDLTTGAAAWVTRGCASARIRTISLPARGTVKLRTPACRLRLRRRATLHDGRLRLGISCAGFAIGCGARVTVRAGGRVIARGAARYTRSTPPYAAADLRVGAVGLRLLREHPRTRVRISARIGEPGVLRDPAMPGALTRRTTQVVAVARR